MRTLAWTLLLTLLVPVAVSDNHLPPVENVRVEAGNQVLQIRWDASNDPAVVGYSVFVYAEGRLVQRINASDPSATFRGVNDRAYAVQVAVIDAQGGLGPLSPPVAAMPTLRNDLTFLALGLIVIWAGVWIYAYLLTRAERDLSDRLARLGDAAKGGTSSEATQRQGP